jgi:outer membrane receptor protein involved in Fe transport
LFAVLVANVGDAEIDGLSLDFSAYLWDSVDFGLNLQLLDPKTKADSPELGLVPGARMPFSAEEKGAVWLEYTHPAEFAGGHFYGRAQWTYNGNSLNGISNPTLQPAYQMTDFKVGFQAEDWEIYAYVDNAFNEHAIYFDQFTEVGIITNDLHTISDPRSWGIGFSKSWGPR